MTVYELKINRSIWLAISPFVIIILSFIVFYFWIGDSLKDLKTINDQSKIYTAILGLVIFLGIITIPQTILFFNYLSVSKGIKVEIDNLSKIISVDKNGTKKHYPFSEIASIDRYRPIRGPYYFYYYFVIELKSNENIIITSLMTSDDKLSIDIPNHLELSTWWPIVK